MSMKNLNVFRRLDELETSNLHLQVLLQGARRDIECLKALMRLQVKPKAKPGPKPKPKVVKASEKRREYARKYYAKKRAEKLAVTA